MVRHDQIGDTFACFLANALPRRVQEYRLDYRIIVTGAVTVCRIAASSTGRLRHDIISAIARCLVGSIAHEQHGFGRKAVRDAARRQRERQLIAQRVHAAGKPRVLLAVKGVLGRRVGVARVHV